VLGSVPNYNEDRPNLDRYEDAVDRGRQQRGEREFYDTPFPTEQRERARTRTASPQTGNCRARCEQTANAAVAQQREALKGGGGYNSQVEAQLSQSKKQVLDTCMSTCSGNVTGVDRSCLERCQGATSQDELLSCQRRCYSK
ncbi:MAG: hypothetical protein KDD70_06545, partial [Bdellovibrionales bacterium]|nr:hypothetical protein [Bdellovibrionales bacterium]